ncbi:hypothetical protein MYA98_17350 [Salmonella sp. WGH-01]|nr:hypothetical protein MYA98_17350 [Salmonella sp. WGH-01]
MKPTFMRWVAIAALLAGGRLARWPILPSRRQSPMVLKKMSFILYGRRKGWWRPWMQWRRRLAWIS